MKRFLGVGLVVLGLLALAGPARAQDKKNKDAPAAELRVAQLNGSVVAVKPGPAPQTAIIEMKNADKSTYFVKIEPKTTKVKVEGTALADFLKPGQFVRFTAFLTRNSVKEPIDSLQIFLPDDGFQVGVFKDNPDDKKSDSLVAAQIKSIKNGKLLMVSAGAQQIKVTLADEVQIEVNVSDYSLARPGDTIKVVGRVVEEPDKVLANDVDITLVEPLSAPEAPAKKGRPGKAAKDKKPAAEDPAAAGDDPPADEKDAKKDEKEKKDEKKT